MFGCRRVRLCVLCCVCRFICLCCCAWFDVRVVVLVLMFALFCDWFDCRCSFCFMLLCEMLFVVVFLFVRVCCDCGWCFVCVWLLLFFMSVLFCDWFACV